MGSKLHVSLPDVSSDITYSDLVFSDAFFLKRFHADNAQEITIKDVLTDFKVILDGKKESWQDCNGGYLSHGYTNILLIHPKTQKLVSVDMISTLCTTPVEYHGLRITVSKIIDHTLIDKVLETHDYSILPNVYKLSHIFRRLMTLHQVKRVMVDDDGWYVIETDRYIFFQRFSLCELFAIDKIINFVENDVYSDIITDRYTFDEGIHFWSEHLDGTYADESGCKGMSFYIHEEIDKCSCNVSYVDFPKDMFDLGKFYVTCMCEPTTEQMNDSIKKVRESNKIYDCSFCDEINIEANEIMPCPICDKYKCDKCNELCNCL